MKKVFTLFVITFLATGLIKAQEKTTLNVKDLNSGIEKYVKKTYPEFKITEAFKYDLVYGIKIQKGDTVAGLIFDRNGKFKSKVTEAEKEKYALQTRTTMSLDDLESDITKYIKKNHEGYKPTEAFSFDEVYVVKVIKGDESETLLFDKEGKFVKKTGAAKAAVPPAPVVKTDSVPAKPAAPAVKTDTVPAKIEPAKNDSIK